MTPRLRTRFLVAALALPAIASGLSKDEAIKRFTDANGHYEAGVEATAAKDHNRAVVDFRKAAAAYEAILSAGYQNGQISYNLGNAYYRLGKLGKAIVSYRRAQRLLPRRAEVAANLRQAKTLIQDKENLPKAPELVILAFFWHFCLNLDELLVATLIAYGLLALLLLANILARKQWLRPAAGVAGVVFLMLAASLWVKFRGEVLVARGVVTHAEAAVRYGGGSHYSKKFDVHEGADVIVSDARTDDQGRRWIKGTFFLVVKTKDGPEPTTVDERSGWVPADAIERVRQVPSQPSTTVKGQSS